MKNLTLLIFTLSGMALSLSACKDDCTDGPCDSSKCVVNCDNINAAPQELLDYFVFNEGSYWVYQLNGTDTLDTLTFAGMDSEYFELQAGCNFGITPCEMRYTLFFNHSNLDKFPPGNLKIKSSNEIYSIGYSSYRDQWDVSHTSGSGGSGSFNYFLAYPFEKNQIYETNRYLKDTAEIITVPAGEFKCITTSRSTVANKPYRIQYMSFSKNVGMVKYEIALDQTWELIDYHIE